MAAKVETDKCILRGCSQPVRSKGLCERHYLQAYKQVKRHDVTWTWLVRNGLALPSKRITDISKAINRAKAKSKRPKPRPLTP